MRVSDDLVSDVAEVLLTESRSRPSRRARPPDQRRLRRPGADTRQRAQGFAAVHGRPHAADQPALRIDLMEVSSYGGTSTESSGLVRILKDLSAPIEGREVLLVEDIIDTASPQLPDPLPQGKNPSSIKVCSLLTSRPGAWSRFRSTMLDSRSPTLSWWGMVSTSGGVSEPPLRGCPPSEAYES